MQPQEQLHDWINQPKSNHLITPCATNSGDGRLKGGHIKAGSDPSSYAASSLPWANPAWLLELTSTLRRMRPTPLHVITPQQKASQPAAVLLQQEITTIDTTRVVQDAVWGCSLFPVNLKVMCFRVFSPAKLIASCLNFPKRVAGACPNATVRFTCASKAALHFSKRFLQLKNERDARLQQKSWQSTMQCL